VKETPHWIAIGALAALAGGGCRPGPEPEALFADAEALRARYERAASERAIAEYREAQAAWVRRGDAARAARAGERIGTTFSRLGAPHDALQAYEQALALARRSVDRGLQSEVLTGLGLAESLVAEGERASEEARKHCEEALDIARQLGAGREEATALSCLGEVAYDRQRPEQALELYRDAERLWERLGDPGGRAESLRLQGAVHSDLSDLDAAGACYQRALSLSTSPADRRERAIALVLKARLQERRGEYQKALDEYEDALALLQPMGDAVWEGSALTGVAAVFLETGQAGPSLRYWERALQLFESAGLKSIATDVLMALGETHLALGHDAEALRRFERARDLAEELEIDRWKAYALRYIGVIQLFRRRPEGALENLERSLKEQQSLDDGRLRARSLADVGEAHELMGRHDVAVADFERALALAGVAGDRVAKARALFGLARSSAGLGALDAARRYVEQSLAVTESLRTEMDNRELRSSYAASVYSYNEFHVDVLMRLHRTRRREGLAAAALEASERGRARSLLESLREAGVDLRHGMDPALLRRAQALDRAFAEWGERQGRPGRAQGQAAALAEEYRELEHRYDQVQAEIRRRSPRYAALAQPQSLRLKDVQEQVLDPDTLLLEYALGEERSYLWAVSRDRLSSRELPPRAEIERAAMQAYARLTARLTAGGPPQDRRRQVEQADTEYWPEAERLASTLLGPVASEMTGKRIVVIADGALQYLPFAALPVPGRNGVPMAIEHEVVSLPSASVLAVLRRETATRKPAAKTIAVLADPVFEADDPRLPPPQRSTPAGASGGGSRDYPRLAATRQEAAAIVRLVPEGTALRALGFDASRATAMSPDLAQYRILHFATHGLLDNENPGLSGIVLSMFGERGQPQDGMLRLHDIYGLRLPADLVVLSACSTALGKPVRGEGLVGIVRGFMYAGAKRVVASLWKVDDEATGEMMGRFYKGMLEGSRSPAAALREAQIGMWKQERWRSPYYWAAFVLQGEWR
jgi:CHAT domain-containing protein